MVGRNNTFITKKVPKIVVFITHSNCIPKPTIFSHYGEIGRTHAGQQQKELQKYIKTIATNRARHLSFLYRLILFPTVCTPSWLKMGRRRQWTLKKGHPREGQEEERLENRYWQHRGNPSRRWQETISQAKLLPFWGPLLVQSICIYIMWPSPWNLPEAINFLGCWKNKVLAKYCWSQNPRLWSSYKVIRWSDVQIQQDNCFRR